MKKKTIVMSRKLRLLLEEDFLIKVNGEEYAVQLRLRYFTLHDSTDCAILSMDDEPIWFDDYPYNYFCYNSKNKITYWNMKKGEQPVNENGLWKAEGREEIKPGKFILLFSDYILVRYHDGLGRVENSEIVDKVKKRFAEVFVEMVKGCNTKLDFEITSDVSSVYETENHPSAGAYLQNSCMRVNSDYSCSHFSGFYNCIPNVKIAYQKVEGMLLFRALIWENVEVREHNPDEDEWFVRENRYTFLDRVYGSESIEMKMIQHAKDSGWLWRKFDSSKIMEGDKVVNVSLKVELSYGAFGYLEEEGNPYPDTLYMITSEGYSNYLISRRIEDEDEDYDLQCCDGNVVSNRELLRCENCNGPIEEDEAYHHEGSCYCEDCFYREFARCENCNEYYRNESIHECDGDLFCENCIGERDDIRQCDICNGYHYTHNENFEEDDHGNFACERCYEEVKNHKCSMCGTIDFTSNFFCIENVIMHLCRNCWVNNVRHCDSCNKVINGALPLKRSLSPGAVIHICDACAETYERMKESQESEIVPTKREIKYALGTLYFDMDGKAINPVYLPEYIIGAPFIPDSLQVEIPQLRETQLEINYEEGGQS